MAGASSLVPSFVFDVLTTYADMETPTVNVAKNMQLSATDAAGSLSCFYEDATVASKASALANKITLVDKSVAFDGGDAIEQLSVAFGDFLHHAHTAANAKAWGDDAAVKEQLRFTGVGVGADLGSVSASFLTKKPNANTFVAHAVLKSLRSNADSNFQTKQMARLAEVFLMFNVLMQVAGYGYAANIAAGANLQPVDYAYMAWNLMKRCYEVDAGIWNDDTKGFAHVYKELYAVIQANSNVSGDLGTNAKDVAVTKKVLMSTLTAELEADAGLWSARLWLWVWVAATAIALGAIVASAGNRRALAAVGGTTVGTVVLAFVLNSLSILTTSASAPTPLATAT